MEAFKIGNIIFELVYGSNKYEAYINNAYIEKRLKSFRESHDYIKWNRLKGINDNLDIFALAETNRYMNEMVMNLCDELEEEFEQIVINNRIPLNYEIIASRFQNQISSLKVLYRIKNWKYDHNGECIAWRLYMKHGVKYVEELFRSNERKYINPLFLRTCHKIIKIKDEK